MFLSSCFLHVLSKNSRVTSVDEHFQVDMFGKHCDMFTERF